MTQGFESWNQLSQILKTLRQPIDPDDDDLPEFDLHDATVQDRKGTMTSLLMAKENNVLIITGYLDCSSKLKKHFLSKKEKSVPIIYSGVDSFAYDDAGTLWALSSSGWLTIVSTSKEYEPIFHGMKWAIRLWYYIQDHKKKRWTVKEWATNWRRASSLDTVEEKAEASLAMYADFIYAEMEKEESSWSSTTIYKFMKDAAPFAAETRKLEKNSFTSNMALRSKTKIGKFETKQESGLNRGNRIADVPEETTLLNNQKADGSILWKFLHSRCKLWTLHEATQLLCTFFELDTDNSRNYLFYQAENLLKYMKKSPFSGTELCDSLSESSLSPKLVGKMAKTTLRPRDSKKAMALIGEFDAHSSTDEDIPAFSRLRPRMEKARKRYTATLNRLSDKEMEAFIGSKRKKPHDNEEQDVDDPQELLPFGHQDSDQNVPVLIKEYKVDPFQIDEDGVWRCNQTDCLHVVYGADTELGEEMVKMHMEDHEETEVDIVMREMHATKLPATNLLNRIRNVTMARNMVVDEPDGLNVQRIRKLI